MESLIELFDYPLTIVDFVTYGLGAIGVFGVWYFAVIAIIRISWRLGSALARNKIAIFADYDNFSDLEKVLVDSSLFKKKNITHIGKNNIGSAASADLFLVYWPVFNDKLDKVLGVKNHSVSIVVYAPKEKICIDDDSISKLNEHHNVMITNFRGRLLNDVFVSMVTTKRIK